MSLFSFLNASGIFEYQSGENFDQNIMPIYKLEDMSKSMNFINLLDTSRSTQMHC